MIPPGPLGRGFWSVDSCFAVSFWQSSDDGSVTQANTTATQSSKISLKGSLTDFGMNLA